MRIKWYGISAILLVCALVVIGCEAEDTGGDGGGIVSTMGAPGIKDIANIQIPILPPDPSNPNPPPTPPPMPVTTRSDAISLFEDLASYISGYNYNVTNLENILQDADETAFNEAFVEKYNMTQMVYYFTLLQNPNAKSASISVDIDNTSALSGGTIKGSEKGSISLNNQTLAQYLGSSFSGTLIDEGDSVSMSASSSRTFTINQGITIYREDSQYNPSSGNYVTIKIPLFNVAGIIKIESSGSSSQTLKEIDNSSFYGSNIYTYSSNSVNKISAVLVVSDGTRVGKFRFSFAENYSGNARSADSSGSSNYSDIDVYNAYTNELISAATIPANAVNNSRSAWLNLASSFGNVDF